MGDQWRAAFNTRVNHCFPEEKRGGFSEDIIVSRRAMLHVCTGELSIADLNLQNKSFVILEVSCVSLFPISLQDHLWSVF